MVKIEQFNRDKNFYNPILRLKIKEPKELKEAYLIETELVKLLKLRVKV